MACVETKENQCVVSVQENDHRNGPKSRKQRQKANQNADEFLPREDDNSIEGLRVKMEIAKAENDTNLVNNLRQKIWLMKDRAAGFKSNVSPDQLNSILQESKKPISEETVVVLDTPPLPNQPLHKIQDEVLNKKLRKLQKKRDDITKLKERKEKGEQLELTQIAKITKEKIIDDQIDDVEEEIFQLKRRTK